jgi:hypothetical protein
MVMLAVDVRDIVRACRPVQDDARHLGHSSAITPAQAEQAQAG